MNVPVIRMAVESDCAAITACAEAAYQMYVERIGKPPAPMVADFKAQISDGKIYVLSQGLPPTERQLSGFVVCFQVGSDKRRVDAVADANSDVFFLENIAVNPCVQRSGFGLTLIKHVIALARDSGCSSIELYTNELMTENIAWYKKLGFSEFDHVVEDGFSRVYMRLLVDN